MDTWIITIIFVFSFGDAALMPTKLENEKEKENDLEFFVFFFSVGDCLYAKKNYNFGLALIQDLYISWSSAIVRVIIAFMPVEDYLKASGSLKSALKG